MKWFQQNTDFKKQNQTSTTKGVKNMRKYLTNSEMTEKVNSLINEIEKVTGKKAIINHMPEQAGDVPKTFADISKAKRLLNYEPKTNLTTGLQKFYEWFQENEENLMQ